MADKLEILVAPADFHVALTLVLDETRFTFQTTNRVTARAWAEKLRAAASQLDPPPIETQRV